MKTFKPTRSEDATVVRLLMVETIKQSKLSRDQIADTMTALLQPNFTISGKMLDAYTAVSRNDRRLPLQFAAAFCEAAGDFRLLREIVKRAGFRMVGPREENLIAIGAAVVAKAKAEAVIAKAVAR